MDWCLNATEWCSLNGVSPSQRWAPHNSAHPLDPCLATLEVTGSHQRSWGYVIIVKSDMTGCVRVTVTVTVTITDKRHGHYHRIHQRLRRHIVSNVA